MTLMTLDEFTDILFGHLPVWETMRLLPPAEVLPFLRRMFEADVQATTLNDVQRLTDKVQPIMKRYLSERWTEGEIAAFAGQYAAQWYLRPYYWLAFFMFYRHLADLPQLVEVEGLELLQEQLKRGKGALVVPPHLGISLVPPLLLTALGYRTHTVTNQEEVPFIQELIERFGAPGQLVTVADQMPLLSAYKRLQQNEVVVIYPELTASDRKPRNTAQFLGQRVQAPEGPAALAAAAGVPMLPVALVRTGEDRFRFVFGQPIAVGGTDRTHVAEATQRLWDWIEGWVLTAPDQWWLWTQFEKSMLALAPAAAE